MVSGRLHHSFGNHTSSVLSQLQRYTTFFIGCYYWRSVEPGNYASVRIQYNITECIDPTLVVVIGIPNCIYFLNKYHTSFNDTGEKNIALVEMIRRMGIVTLFCNIAAAIGFAVFALTKSAILKEFGVVAGINIMALFFISIILIPAVLSFLPSPKKRHTKYLENKWLLVVLDKLETWSLHHQRFIYGFTVLILAVAVAGIFRLRSEGFIVDDLPKTDKLYLDLKFLKSISKVSCRWKSL